MINENMITLNPLQIDILNEVLFQDTSYIAVRAGWGSGKTTALVMTLIAFVESHPNLSSLIITDTAMRFRSILLPEIQKWAGKYNWTFHAADSKFLTPNGHVIWARAYFRPGTRDASHNALEGLNITSGLCLIDECQTLDEEVAHKALGRLRSGARVKLVLTGLPVWGCWWVNLAEKAGGKALFYTSYVNQKNLSKDWFDAAHASLPEEELRAMIYNEPRAREGLVYNEWTPSNVIDNFIYDSSMSGRVSIDWGFRKPSVLIIVYCPQREASIIVKELNPQEIKLEDLRDLILEVACPRELSSKYPNRILLDGACGDKAGASTNDQSALSNFRILAKPINEGGLGMPFKWCTDPIRTDILNGINRVKRLISQKKILCTREVWEEGANSKGNSFRKAILSYAWDSKEKPVKDGKEDPLDALRYDVLNWSWRDNQTVPGQAPKVQASASKFASSPFASPSNTFSLKNPINYGSKSNGRMGF